MQERRRQDRYPIGVDARYVDDCEHQGVCMLADISGEGVRIQMRSDEKPLAGTTMELAIDFPMKVGPMKAEIDLRWVRVLEGHSEYNFEAGGGLVLKESSEMALLKKYILKLVTQRLDRVFDTKVESSS